MRQEIQAQVEALIGPILDDFGYELVDLQYKKEGRSMALCIFIDKPGGITLDDCVTVSREVGAILEIEDPIKAGYRLEVSSPGLDRPLKKPADFERFAGQKIKLKTLRMLDPDKRGKSRKKRKHREKTDPSGDQAEVIATHIPERRENGGSINLE